MTKYEQIEKDITESLEKGTGPHASLFDRVSNNYGDCKQPTRSNANPYTGAGIHYLIPKIPKELAGAVKKKLEEGKGTSGLTINTLADTLEQGLFSLMVKRKCLEQELASIQLDPGQRRRDALKKSIDTAKSVISSRTFAYKKTFVWFVVAVEQVKAALAEAAKEYMPKAGQLVNTRTGATTSNAKPEAITEVTKQTETQRIINQNMSAKQPSKANVRVPPVSPPRRGR